MFMRVSHTHDMIGDKVANKPRESEAAAFTVPCLAEIKSGAS